MHIFFKVRFKGGSYLSEKCMLGERYSLNEKYVLDVREDKFNLNYVDAIGEMYKLYQLKMDEICKFLDKQGTSSDEWDITFINEDTKKIKASIIADYYIDANLDWKIQFTNIVCESIIKNFRKFDLLKKVSTDELDRYERYYDVLCNMFSNLEEIIEIKYNAFIDEKKSMLAQETNDLRDVSVRYNSQYLTTLTNDDMRIAA